ncbi:DUF4388 domain-containing protein [Thermodesulfobacteriota bacterium]
MNRHSGISGGLGFISLAEIFQLLGGNNCTGQLHLTSPYSPSRGLIYFVDGNPVNALNGSLQGLDALYALFGWTDGGFEFREDRVQIGRTIMKGRMELVLDALRMLDDGLIEKVGPPMSDNNPQDGNIPILSGGRLPVIKGPLVDYTHLVGEEELRDGKSIVSEGNFGNWIWVILEGLVEIKKNTPKGPIILARLGEGSFIGTFSSFLFADGVRQATATAVGDVFLGLLDIERLAAEYRFLSADFKGLLISLTRRLGRVTERAVGLTTNISENLGTMPGTDLFLEKGSMSSDAFAITGGESYVIIETNGGSLPLLKLERSDVFGFMPFMEMGHEPHSAAIFGTKDLGVQTLDMDKLRWEYEGLSGTFKSLISNMSDCVSTTTGTVCRLARG